MWTFLKIHGSDLKRLVTSFYLFQLTGALLLLCTGSDSSFRLAQLLIFQPIVVACVGSASLGLRLARDKVPSLGWSPAIWVGLSYCLAALVETSWHSPRPEPLLLWGALGLLASLFIAFRCLWIASGRRLPLGTKVSALAFLSVFFSMAIFGLFAASHQNASDDAQLKEKLSSQMRLLASQIEGGQKWKALTGFPAHTELAVYSKEGALLFYQGEQEARREIKELGWELPSPTGSFEKDDSVVVWEKFGDEFITLARHKQTNVGTGLLSILFGSVLAGVIVGFFVRASVRELTREREQKFEAIVRRLRRDEGASSYHLWEPEVRSLADQLVNWSRGLRLERDNLQGELNTVCRRNADQAKQIETMGKRFQVLKELQESLRLEAAIPLVGKHLETISDKADVSIWLYEAGRVFLVYGDDHSDSAGSIEFELTGEERVLGKVRFHNVDRTANHRILQRAVSRITPFLEKVKKAEEGERLASLFHNLLKPKLPEVARLQVDFQYLPSKVLSGDLLDLFPLKRDGLYSIVVADVLGKGPVAAATALRVKETIRVLSEQGHGPEAIAATLNQRICETDSRMLTLFIAHLDIDNSELAFCSCGHEEVLLRKRNGEILSLEANSMMLGVLPDGEFEKTVVPMEAHDELLFFTDGVTESRSPAGEQFGIERVRQMLARSKGPSHTSELLMFQIRQFCEGHFTDDVSLLCVQIEESQAAES